MNPGRLLLALLRPPGPPGAALLRPPARSAASSPVAFACRTLPSRTAGGAAHAVRRTSVGAAGDGGGGGDARDDSSPDSVAIVGGGLAGLSVAYHLVSGGGGPSLTGDEGKRKRRRRLTVFDVRPVGEGGASSGEFEPRGRGARFPGRRVESLFRRDSSRFPPRTRSSVCCSSRGRVSDGRSSPRVSLNLFRSEGDRSHFCDLASSLRARD